MVTPTLQIEHKLWKSGYHYVAGLDEVGRGSFAGPVVVGAVVFPKSIVLPVGIADSKFLKPRQREKLSEEIKKTATSWFIAEIGVSVINKKGISKATQMAFRKAIKLLSQSPDFILIDAFYIQHLNRKRQKAVKDGDKLMKKLHKKYPQYGFAKHKGYGTKKHQEAIRKYGLSRIHRKSFNLQKFMA